MKRAIWWPRAIIQSRIFDFFSLPYPPLPSPFAGGNKQGINRKVELAKFLLEIAQKRISFRIILEKCKNVKKAHGLQRQQIYKKVHFIK